MTWDNYGLTMGDRWIIDGMQLHLTSRVTTQVRWQKFYMKIAYLMYATKKAVGS